MIEKDKTYTYEDLKDIVSEACANTIVELENDIEEAKCDNKFSVITSFNALLVLSMLTKTLFSKKKEEEE